jgi:nicotinate phosphoribosyltransferase
MSLADGILFTDHYQLTMAQLYFRMGLDDRKAQFDHTFRSYPDYGSHQAGYCVAAGLAPFLDWMDAVHFDDEALEAIRAQRSHTGDQLFADDFIDYLKGIGGFDSLEIRAVLEGRVVHPDTPITSVRGPIILAQLIETSLLHHLNFPTLIATKASRVAEAAHGGSVLEFGMRRAQSANVGTRSALIGGADGSSNEGMSLELGLVPRGTHAHSMVQVFMAIAGGELDAFRAYAAVYPDECLLLVDTIDTLESGIPNAITVFEELRRKGHEPVGVRLDSGDLAHLAVRSAALLDAAGFPDVRIVLSSQLDELTIFQIRNQIVDEAPKYGVDAVRLLSRLVYGVGSRMITSDGDPSLDGVYKVVAVEDHGEFVPAIKISDTPAKIANPGLKDLWRVYDERGRATADLMTLPDDDLDARPLELFHPSVPGVYRRLRAERISGIEPLLVDVFSGGSRSVDLGGIPEANARRRADLDRLDTGVRRLVNPHRYHVSLSRSLWHLKQSLIERFSGSNGGRTEV